MKTKFLDESFLILIKLLSLAFLVFKLSMSNVTESIPQLCMMTPLDRSVMMECLLQSGHVTASELCCYPVE